MARNSRTEAIRRRKVRSAFVPQDIATETRPAGKALSRRALTYLAAAMDVEQLRAYASVGEW